MCRCKLVSSGLSGHAETGWGYQEDMTLERCVIDGSVGLTSFLFGISNAIEIAFPELRIPRGGTEFEELCDGRSFRHRAD